MSANKIADKQYVYVLTIQQVGEDVFVDSVFNTIGLATKRMNKNILEDEKQELSGLGYEIVKMALNFR